MNGKSQKNSFDSPFNSAIESFPQVFSFFKSFFHHFLHLHHSPLIFILHWSHSFFILLKDHEWRQIHYHRSIGRRTKGSTYFYSFGLQKLWGRGLYWYPNSLCISWFDCAIGKLRINRVGDKSSYLQDWFHTLAAFSTPKIIIVIVSAVYDSVIFVWNCLVYHLHCVVGLYLLFGSFPRLLRYQFIRGCSVLQYWNPDNNRLHGHWYYVWYPFSLFTFLNVFFILQDCT